MKKETKFDVGDLVTYCDDRLGVPGFNGIVTDVYCDQNGLWYAMILWVDGAHHCEMFKHIVLLNKAKDERK